MNGRKELVVLVISANNCRVCLKECNEEKLSMSQFADLFTKCTGVEACQQDIPKAICSDCVSNLYYVHRFIKQVEKTENVLANLSKNVEAQTTGVKDEYKEERVFSGYEEMLDEDNSIEYLEEEIPIDDITMVNLNESPEKSEVLTELVDVLEDGHYPAPDISEENIRLEKLISNENLPKKQQNSRKTVICEYCKAEFRPTSLQRHINNVHFRIRHECSHCGRFYTIKENLQAHIKKHHLGQQTKHHQCNECDKVYKSWAARYYHQIREHNKNYKHCCEYCEKPFLHKTQMEDHIASHHTGIKHRQCPMCDDMFLTLDTLAWHKETVHGNQQRQQCRFCCKTFKRKRHLNRHEKTHTDKKEGELL